MTAPSSHASPEALTGASPGDAPRRAELDRSARRDELGKLVARRTFTHIDEITSLFGVSTATARTDLRVLAERGVVMRVRGGAVPLDRPLPERTDAAASPWGLDRGNRFAPVVEDDPTAAVEAPAPPEDSTPVDDDATRVADDAELASVAVAAVALLRSGDTVALDGGPIGLHLAEALVAAGTLHDLVAVTADLRVALALQGAAGRVRVMVTGGTLHPELPRLEGPRVGAVLDALRVDVALLGCDGLTSDQVTGRPGQVGEVWQQMFHAGRRRVVLAAGRVVGVTAAFPLCVPEVLDACVVGGSAELDALDAVRDTGVAVVVTTV